MFIEEGEKDAENPCIKTAKSINVLLSLLSMVSLVLFFLKNQASSFMQAPIHIV